MKQPTFRVLAALAAVSAASTAWAIPGQQTTAAGDAFASACAGNGFNGIGTFGNALNNGTGFTSGSPPSVQSLACTYGSSATPGAQVQTGTLNGGGTFFGNVYSNSASAIAKPGVIKLQASNSGSSGDAFSGAGAQGGWNETFTPSGGGAPGTNGILVIPMHVSGQMDSTNIGANGLTELGVYKNHSFVQPYGTATNQAAYDTFKALNTAFNPHIAQNSVAEGTVLFGWDYQMKPWGAVDYGNTPLTTNSLTINETVSFAIPIVWDQPFLLGVYAATSAGETAYGGTPIQNTSDEQFGNTIYWTGDYYALAPDGTGPHITGFNLASGSGLDYSQSFAAPEPASLALLGGGIAATGLLRRRTRRV